MKALRRLVCRVVGHEPWRMQIGPYWIDACLRCQERLDESPEARDLRLKR